MSRIIDEALDRLKKQRDADYLSPWSPGKQPTDAEAIWAYIERLKADLDIAREREFLAGWEDRSGGQFSQDEIDRARGDRW